jgi:hypothetical protein
MGIRQENNLRVRTFGTFDGGSSEANDDFRGLLRRYLELNGLSRSGGNVVIKRGTGNKKLAASSPAAAPAVPNAIGSGTGNPIFMHNPDVYAEAQRQMNLMGQTLGNHNLLHVLRNITIADSNGVELKPETRSKWMDGYRSTIVDAQQTLLGLDQGGYLDIILKRRKYHDYKAGQRAYDTWNSILLYEALSSDKKGPGGRSQEHYLVPFDAQSYLDKSSSGTPEDLGGAIGAWHLVPYRDSFIGVMGDRAGVDLLDLRDMDLSEKDLKTPAHQQLFRYIAAPSIPDSIVDLHGLYRTRGDLVTPRYRMDQTIMFRGKSGKHYQVPEQFLTYLYNNYYGEDLDLEVIDAPGAAGPHLTGTTNNYSRSYGGSSSASTYLLAARRSGSGQPLVLYRFQQIDANLNTIR